MSYRRVCKVFESLLKWCEWVYTKKQYTYISKLDFVGVGSLIVLLSSIFTLFYPKKSYSLFVCVCVYKVRLWIRFSLSLSLSLSLKKKKKFKFLISRNLNCKIIYDVCVIEEEVCKCTRWDNKKQEASHTINRRSSCVYILSYNL